MIISVDYSAYALKSKCKMTQVPACLDISQVVNVSIISLTFIVECTM